jgi:hypothetical protein
VSLNQSREALQLAALGAPIRCPFRFSRQSHKANSRKLPGRRASRKLKGVGYEGSRTLTNASYSPCASGEEDAPVWIARQAGPNPFAKFRPPLFA